MDETHALHFFDRKGRYIIGRVLEDSTLLVLKSNIASPGAKLNKNPYWDWEKAATVRDGATLLKPKALIRLTRLFDSDWGESEEYEEPEAA